MAKPTEEQIRQRAQEIWEENHRPAGRDDEFWHQAEKSWGISKRSYYCAWGHSAKRKQPDGLDPNKKVPR
jgi:hypothetical protein